MELCRSNTNVREPLIGFSPQRHRENTKYFFVFTKDSLCPLFLCGEVLKVQNVLQIFVALVSFVFLLFVVDPQELQGPVEGVEQG
jgi:hypothetical protein